MAVKRLIPLRNSLIRWIKPQQRISTIKSQSAIIWASCLNNTTKPMEPKGTDVTVFITTFRILQPTTPAFTTFNPPCIDDRLKLKK